MILIAVPLAQTMNINVSLAVAAALGGGIFGAYAALYLAQKGLKVAIVESGAGYVRYLMDRLDEKYRVYLEDTQPQEWLFELSKGRQVQTNEMWVRLKVFLRSKLQLYFFDQAQTEAETPEEMPSTWVHQEKLEDYISLHFNGLAAEHLPQASQRKAQGS